MRSDRGAKGAEHYYPSSSSDHLGLLTTRGLFLPFPFPFKSHLSRRIAAFSRLKTWSCDAIHLRRSSEGEETREDLLAIMDYSKAQMVSIDGLGTAGGDDDDDAATRVCYSNKANVARFKVPHCPFCA